MSKILDKIIEYYSDEELLIADGFDDAVIGIDEKSMRIIYSVSKCLTIDALLDEAVEYFEFNVTGAYMGEKTPIWCYDGFDI
jgi:hypothetical protein